MREVDREGTAIRLLEAIAIIAEETSNKKNCAALLRHANMIRRGSHDLLEELDP